MQMYTGSGPHAPVLHMQPMQQFANSYGRPRAPFSPGQPPQAPMMHPGTASHVFHIAFLTGGGSPQVQIQIQVQVQVQV
jgi:hypothetical protein